MAVFTDLPGSIIKINPYYGYYGDAICFRLPYSSGDAVAFQLGYTAAGLAEAGVSEADLMGFFEWRDAGVLTVGQKNTAADVIRFGATTVAAPYTTEKYLDVYYTAANLITAGTNGTFETNATGTNATQSNVFARTGTYSGRRAVTVGAPATPFSGSFTFNTFAVTTGKRYWVRYSLRYEDAAFSGLAQAPSITGVTGTLAPITVPTVIDNAWLDYVYQFTATQTGTASLVLGYSGTVDAAGTYYVYADEVKVNTLALAGTQAFVPAQPHLSLVLKYRHGSDAYKFDYQTDTAFFNQIRVPAIFANYEPSVKEKVVDQPDGSRVRTFARVSKSYGMEIDLMPDVVMEALFIALTHGTTEMGETSVGVIPYIVTDFKIDENTDRTFDYRGAVAKARLQSYNQQASYC